MASPILPEPALAALRARQEASLAHRATLETLERIRTPDAEYVERWTAEAPQPARMNPAAAGGTNIVADQPVTAGDWVLCLKSGVAITEGQRVLVTGSTRGAKWQKLVSVEKVLHPRSSELLRRALCRDVALVP